VIRAVSKSPFGSNITVNNTRRRPENHPFGIKEARERTVFWVKDFERAGTKNIIQRMPSTVEWESEIKKY
jgi:hypothetical protein